MHKINLYLDYICVYVCLCMQHQHYSDFMFPICVVYFYFIQNMRASSFYQLPTANRTLKIFTMIFRLHLLLCMVKCYSFVKWLCVAGVLTWASSFTTNKQRKKKKSHFLISSARRHCHCITIKPHYYSYIYIIYKYVCIIYNE